MDKFGKYILCTVVAFTVLPSCYKDIVDGDTAREIQFSVPQMNVETRSTTKDFFEKGDAFGVFGYCVPYTVGTTNPNYSGGSSIWALKKKLCPPDVFYKQKVVVGENACTYDRNGLDSNNPKYWYRNGYDTNNSSNSAITNTKGYKYSFIAYYPYDNGFSIETPTDKNSAGAPILTFTMPQEGNTNDTKLSHKETPDAMLSVLYNRTQEDGNLSFNFSHVLTALGFEVNNFSEYNLIIHSIKLRGSFYKQVKIDFTGDNVSFSFPESRYTGTYTIFDGTELTDGGLKLPAPKDGEIVTSSPSPIGPILDGGKRNDFIMLISGAETSFGENVEVIIDYTFNEGRKQAMLIRPGTFTPQPGVKYTAQLNFVGDAFVLQFVVDNSESWENGADDDGNSDNDDIIFE